MEILTADLPSPAQPTQPPVAARVAVGLIFFGNGVLNASWVSRIPAVQSGLTLSHETLGLVLFGLALGALVAMPLAGWATSRFGSRRVCQFMAVLSCASLPLAAIAPGAGTLALALFCLGATSGALDVAMNTQAVAVETRYGRPIMTSFHAYWSLGGLTGAALGGMVAAGGMSPLTHFCLAALFLGGLNIVGALPRLLDADEASARKERKVAAVPWKFAWPPRTLLALGVVAFCIMMGEGAMADWSAIFLRDFGGASEALAAAGYAAFSITMAAARFSGDAVSARIGPVALVRTGSALAAGGLALALIVPAPAFALAGFAAVGAGFATIVPQVFSAAGRIPGMAPGPALATMTTIGYGGFLVGPPLIGFAAEHIGLRAALGIVVVMSVLAITLAPFVSGARSSGQAVREPVFER
jgi:MFS family permease